MQAKLEFAEFFNQEILPEAQRNGFELEE